MCISQTRGQHVCKNVPAIAHAQQFGRTGVDMSPISNVAFPAMSEHQGAYVLCNCSGGTPICGYVYLQQSRHQAIFLYWSSKHGVFYVTCLVWLLVPLLSHLSGTAVSTAHPLPHNRLSARPHGQDAQGTSGGYLNAVPPRCPR